MKRQLTLMLAIIASICYGNAQEGNNDVSTTNTDRYYLVTSKDDLHNGDKVIIVGEANNDSYPVMAESTEHSNKSVFACKNEDESFSPVTGIKILIYEKTRNKIITYLKTKMGNISTGMENRHTRTRFY